MDLSEVAVTGGNGLIGSAIIRELSDNGYQTCNLARGERREEYSDRYLRTDLTDPADVHSSLARTDADAIIHMGTIGSPHGASQHTIYESNVLSAVYILEAAAAQGIDTVVLPSSINAIGAEYSEAPVPVEYLPMDESHAAAPDDIYGVSKRAMEVTADGITKENNDLRTIASFRYPWVANDEMLRERLVGTDRSLGDGVEPPEGRDTLYTYLHLYDAARAARLAVESEFVGYETFWIVASDTTIEAPSDRVAREVYGTEPHRPLEGTETLVSIKKARDLLGWSPEYSWRSL